MTEVTFRALSHRRALLCLAEGAEVHFRGKVRIVEVLKGNLRVLGSTLGQGTPPRDVFSPRGYSLLNLAVSSAGNSRHLDTDITARLTNLGLEDVDSASSDCLVVLERLDAPWTQILDHYLPHCHHKSNVSALFNRDMTSGNTLAEQEKILDVNLWTDDCKARLYKENPQWEVAVKSVKIALNDLRQPRVVITGGKGVGKSTFLRYLTNRLLDEVGGPVGVIDLDPGQAEFTPPGCISAVRIERDFPILGPNCANQDRSKTLCVNLGEVNVSNVARRFSRQMARMVRNARAHPDLNRLPWVVNTMGFNRGLGLKLIREVVAAVGPSTLVEIRSRFPGKNYEVNFDALAGDSCNVLRFDAVPESQEAKNMGANDLWGIPEPAKLRDIAVLSYFGRLYRGPASTTFLQSVRPYRVAWADVWVQVLHGQPVTPAQVPAVINMSLVSLGKVDEAEDKFEKEGMMSGEPPPEPCVRLLNSEVSVDALGFGFIRAVDISQKLFYVVTPLSLGELKQVNCLSVGAVNLPKGILLNQKNRKSAPYRSRHGPSPLAQPWQRYSKPKHSDNS